MRFLLAAVMAAVLVTPMAWADELPPAPVDTVPVAPAAVSEPPAPPAPVTEAPKPLPIPVVTSDTSIFKRTPVVDGRIEPGEWDKYFSFDYGDLKSTAYVDWDDNNLYVASRSSAPTDLLVILDAANDGWFHGSDNYELAARKALPGAGPTLSVSRYQSQGAKGTASAPLTAAESSAFTMKVGSSADEYVCEMAIPKSAVHGLDLRPGRKIGIRVAIGVGTEVLWIPISPLGDVEPVELVTSKSSSADGLKISLDLRDSRLSLGDELSAKISVRNVGDKPADIDAIIVGGEGRTAKMLGSQLIRLDGIQPGKTYTTTFKTPVPRSTALGSAALGVEVRSGDERVAASLVSFDVVPAYEVALDPVVQRVSGGDYRIVVNVKNNTRKQAYGTVRLSLPDGWGYRRGGSEKAFLIRGEDQQESIVYRVIPPKKVEGKFPALAEVVIDGHLVSASQALRVGSDER